MGFSLGDRVKLKISGREGIVAAIYEGSFIAGANDETSYMIELDGGVGTTTVREGALEFNGLNFWKPQCECGLRYARSGGKHSSWCPAKEQE